MINILFSKYSQMAGDRIAIFLSLNNRKYIAKNRIFLIMLGYSKTEIEKEFTITNVMSEQVKIPGRYFARRDYLHICYCKFFLGFVCFNSIDIDRNNPSD